MALDNDTMLTLMGTLDAGTSMFGALRPDIRARIYTAVQNPTDETWDDAYSVIISGGWRTLWQALLSHTDYQVTSKPSDGPWPAVPTREQLLTALFRELGSP